ncbi:hypothetical protein [Marivita sp. S2033]|uniref:hypothetical protein n=1 Tax=Marivita sp. S2033 TaxID=3373187 RepID=UPI0039823AA9
MGSVRRGVILSLTPGVAWAQDCAVQRPDWDGAPVSAVQEAMYLAMSPAALALFLASAVAIRFRSQWGALFVVVLWTLFVTALTMLAPASRKVALAEGCVGSPALFIALIAAICVGMIFYTAPPIKGR